MERCGCAVTESCDQLVEYQINKCEIICLCHWNEKILASAEQLRLREKETEPWADRYSDMNSMEKSMLLDELFALRKADKEREAKLLEKLDRMTEQLLALNENSQRLLRQNDELKRMLSDREALIEKLRKENAALKEQKKLSDKNRLAPIPAKLTRKILTAVPLPTFLRRRGERTFRHLPVVNRNGHTARECPTNV